LTIKDIIQPLSANVHDMLGDAFVIRPGIQRRVTCHSDRFESVLRVGGGSGIGVRVGIEEGIRYASMRPEDLDGDRVRLRVEITRLIVSPILIFLSGA
jgi:hypothetical protein